MYVEMKQTSQYWKSGVTMPAEEPDLEEECSGPVPADADFEAPRFESVTKRTVLVGTGALW
jgi:hypothetical protein